MPIHPTVSSGPLDVAAPIPAKVIVPIPAPVETTHRDMLHVGVDIAVANETTLTVRGGGATSIARALARLDAQDDGVDAGVAFGTLDQHQTAHDHRGYARMLRHAATLHVYPRSTELPAGVDLTRPPEGPGADATEVFRATVVDTFVRALEGVARRCAAEVTGTAVESPVTIVESELGSIALHNARLPDSRDAWAIITPNPVHARAITAFFKGGGRRAATFQPKFLATHAANHLLWANSIVLDDYSQLTSFHEPLRAAHVRARARTTLYSAACDGIPLNTSVGVVRRSAVFERLAGEGMLVFSREDFNGAACGVIAVLARKVPELFSDPPDQLRPFVYRTMPQLRSTGPFSGSIVADRTHALDVVEAGPGMVVARLTGPLLPHGRYLLLKLMETIAAAHPDTSAKLTYGGVTGAGLNSQFSAVDWDTVSRQRDKLADKEAATIGEALPMADLSEAVQADVDRQLRELRAGSSAVTPGGLGGEFMAMVRRRGGVPVVGVAVEDGRWTVTYR